VIRARGRPLLELARGLTDRGVGELALTRLLSGRLLLESGQMEELLDEYGASQNRRWSRLRALVAALRNFARIGRALAHVQRRLPTYSLLVACRPTACWRWTPIFTLRLANACAS